MNIAKLIKKESQEIEDELHKAAKNSEEDSGFIGLIRDHTEAIGDNLAWVLRDAENVVSFENKDLAGELMLLKNSIEDLDRLTTDKALATGESKKYLDLLTKIRARFGVLVAKLEQQIQAREKLIGSINSQIEMAERHRKITRRASLRERRFEKRLAENIRGAMKAMDHLLKVELPARINLIKSPPTTPKTYGSSETIARMKEKGEKQSRWKWIR